MPWRPALLRGQRVLARCLADGTYVSEGGRVEVRYRPQDARVYRAAERNLEPAGSEIFPDEHCVPGEPVAAAVAAKGAGERQAKRPRAEPRNGGAREAEEEASPSAEQLIAYTDGACSGNPGPAGLGVVLLDASSRRELSEYLGQGTNNIAELTAILRAVEAVEPGGPSLLVHTDSQYAIGVLQKGWKPKANQELIATLKARLKHVGKVQLRYVPGHKGVPLNERADQLARRAVESRTSPGWQEVKGERG